MGGLIFHSGIGKWIGNDRLLCSPEAHEPRLPPLIHPFTKSQESSWILASVIQQAKKQKDEALKCWSVLSPHSISHEQDHVIPLDCRRLGNVAFFCATHGFVPTTRYNWNLASSSWVLQKLYYQWERRTVLEIKLSRKASANIKWTDLVVLCLSRNVLHGLVNTVFLLQRLSKQVHFENELWRISWRVYRFLYSL